MTEVNFVNAEVLKVGPDEVLIIKIGEMLGDDVSEALFKDLNELLAHVGLKDRSFIVMGEEFEFTVAKRDD